MTRSVLRFGVLLVAVLSAGAPVLLEGTDQAVATIHFGATVGASTSLRLSSSTLRVEARQPGDTGPTMVGSVEYLASARTHTGGDVVLTVEAQRGLEGIVGGPSNDAVAIEFAGSGLGAANGVLHSVPEIAARWQGSGRRTGRLTFTMRGQGPLSGAIIPLRFVLSTP
jgi:hypothetical protein